MVGGNGCVGTDAASIVTVSEYTLKPYKFLASTLNV